MECHICAGLFDSLAGAICSRCGRETCARHLRLAGFLGAEAATTEMIVCMKCIAKTEKSMKFKLKYFADDTIS